MIGQLISLAEQSVKSSSSIQINKKFRMLINDVSNLRLILDNLNRSDILIFVYCSNMIKMIDSGDFCIISETRSQENIVNMIENQNQKIKVYGQIIGVMSKFIIAQNKPKYIIKSCIDLTAICIKIILEEGTNREYIEGFICNFIPSYRVDEKIDKLADTQLFLIESKNQSSIRNGYSELLSVLISAMEFITFQSPTKTYYQFRRNIYVFRSSHMAYFLYFGIEHIKILLGYWLNSQGILDDRLLQFTSRTFVFLEQLFMFPFTMSLHQYETDEDIADNVVGVISGDIYFPSYFRHILCDVALLKNISLYMHRLIEIHSQQYREVKGEIYLLIRILGRIICASQYTFKGDDQRKIARSLSLEIIQNICLNMQYYESDYLLVVLQILGKILVMYGDFYFGSAKSRLIELSLSFTFEVARNGVINIEDGKRNPLSKLFQVLNLCLDCSKNNEDQEIMVKKNCQNILKIVYGRIISNESQVLISRFGINHKTEIQCFQEIFEHIIPTFEANLQQNLNIFQQLDLNSMSDASKIIWLHLCSQLLPKNQASLHQTTIILKYYDLAKQGDNLACLRYIKTLVEQVLSECREGKSVTSLWKYIEDISHQTFDDFILYVIQLCIRNFNIPNDQVIDYSLQIFKNIYVNLKKYDNLAFQRFYEIVKNLLTSIGNTVFANEKYYYKRRKFFNVISIVWLNSGEMSFVYDVHKLIVASCHQHRSPQDSRVLYQFMYDISGLMQPLEKHEAYQVLVELVLQDLKSLFKYFMGTTQQIHQLFSDFYFVKAFVRMVYSMITDSYRRISYDTHTDLPMKMHQLFYPYLTALANGAYQFSNKLITVLDKFVYLNPVGFLIPLPNIIKIMKEQKVEGCQVLIRNYFQHIQQIEDISWMYFLIQDNIDFLVSWWEEAILRELKPSINLKSIADARIWNTSRQREALAKIIYCIGCYDKKYWDVTSYHSERDFVIKFNEHYT